MRANHATKPQEPAPRGVAGARRGIARWLPRPRAVAAAGALLAQLWGFGAPGAYAASADPPRGPAQSAARRALHGAPALGRPTLERPVLDGIALDGQSAERPLGSGQSANGTAEHSPGLLGEPAAEGPVGGVAGAAGVTGAVGALGDTLQDRIRAGGLPLPGQRAAVPDAFALASGLLGTTPAQAVPAETRAPSVGEPADRPSAARRHPGTDRPAAARQREAAEAPPVQEAASTAAAESGPAGPEGAAAAPPSPLPGGGGPPGTVAIADTATVTAPGHGSATATAVLAPIAAGLLLTGAAMCKHRGLPRGH
ncbi:hypothetical protein ACIQOW_36125 [Kitasatospora sp. NPDC091335]|uniref:hypothetical protein n=1 Tax=Kitasatospora sp. NPDC091335 TaxID=3364085 RepID=UPI0037F11E8A